MAIVAGDEPTDARAPAGAGPTQPLGESHDSLIRKAQSSLSWGVASQFLFRAANFASGLVLARLLVPDEFGTFVVALTVLQIVLMFNDLGLMSAIVRAGDDVVAIARTTLTIALTISTVTYAVCLVFAEQFARALGSADAANIVRVLCSLIVIDTIAGVHGALLTRELQEKRRVKADGAGLLVSLPVTIACAAAGLGPWSLAVGRLAGSVVTTIGIWLLAPFKVRPGWHRDVVPGLVAFGLPMVGVGVIGYFIINIDYVFIGRMLGTATLGAYVYAFNVAKWPEGVISVALNRTAVPAFARLAHDPPTLQRAFNASTLIVATAVLPVSALLGILAEDLVLALYGPTWAEASVALQFLAVLGFFSILTGLGGDLLLALGRSRALLWIQIAWLAALIPALLAGIHLHDLAGVGLAHGLVVLVVAVPAYVLTLRAEGISVRPLARLAMRPLVGAATLVAAVIAARSPFGNHWARLLAGGLAGMAAYAVVALPGSPALRAVRVLRNADGATGSLGGRG